MTGVIRHELSHGQASILFGAGEFALTNEGREHFATWSYETLEKDWQRAAFVTAGPLADMIGKGIVDANTNIAVVEMRLSEFLMVDDDGLLDNDAARWKRYSKTLSIVEIENALLIGMKAALCVAKLADRYPAVFEILDAKVAALPEDECLVITVDALEAIAHGIFPIKVSRTYLSNFLNEGDQSAIENEAREEAFRILNEFLERGEITNGHINESGLVRLDLNERR